MWFKRDIWPADDTRMFDDPHFQIFGYAFNKLKIEKDGQIIMKNRKNGALYAIHTNGEVVYFTHAVGLGDKTYPLSIGLAGLHDTYEEGLRVLHTNQKQILAVQNITSDMLIKSFPKNNLGRLLSVGIQTLTETTYDQLIQQISTKSFEESLETKSIIERTKKNIQAYH